MESQQDEIKTDTGQIEKASGKLEKQITEHKTIPEVVMNIIDTAENHSVIQKANFSSPPRTQMKI